MHATLANSSISISDLKKNPSKIINRLHGAPIAILNNNCPTAYLVPAAAFEAMIEQLDDQFLSQLVKDRQHGRNVRVSLNEL